MIDTTTDASEVALAAIRRTDPIVRMRDALAHSERMRELALSRLRVRFPESTTLELVEKLLGQRLIPADSPTRGP